MPADNDRLVFSDNAGNRLASCVISNTASQGHASIFPAAIKSAVLATSSSADTGSAEISTAVQKTQGGTEKHLAASKQGDIASLESLRLTPAVSNQEASDSEEDSDIEAGCDSDDGFDGKCGASPGMISPASTAECSRSNSYKSSRSSETSDDSTATEPSVKWWRRRFRSSKPKQTPSPPLTPNPAQHAAGAINSSQYANTESQLLPTLAPLQRSSSSATSSTRVLPMLTKLRRSVSSRGAPRTTQKPATKQNSDMGLPKPSRLPTKLTRAASVALPSKPSIAAPANPGSSPALSTAPCCDQTADASAVSAAVASTSATNKSVSETVSGQSSSFEAHWALFKCKGMLNLHIVSVPPAICSLNHKDAFLFYPCLFRRVNEMPFSENAQPPSVPDDSSSVSDSLTNTLRHSRMPHGPLLAQEYSRRKSICSLASRVIYVWIGTHASAIKRDAITRVAMEIRDKELMGKAAVIIIDESSAADSARRKFFAQLYTAEHGIATHLPPEIPSLYSQITPLGRAGDDLDFERALERRKVIYGFWESIPPATILSVGADINAAMLLKVPAGGVVVLDTWTDVFIWWRNEPGNTAVRKCAINFANMLVQDACIPTRPKSAAVWHELRGFEHVIFKTKFADWPFVFASSMSSSTQIHRRSAPPANPVMPPAALPLRTVSRQSRVVAVA
ncbi:hypothetical protein IWW45_003749 [Coemansia sp. RSA 485]|nr:hypothetical protein IWW45_003749 [Coemansia sp. RSA 485]